MKRVYCVVFFILLFVFLSSHLLVRADELDDITKELTTLNTQLKDKEANFQKLNARLESIKKKVVFLESEILRKEREVATGEKNLLKQKTLLNERAKSYYKNINKNSVTFLNLLVASNFSTSLENFFYQKTIVDQDRDAIVRIVIYIKDLEEKKISLEKEHVQLAAVKIQINEQSKLLSTEIEGTKQKIASLSAKQQDLLAQKLASLNIPRSASTSLGGCSSDLTNGKDPGFSPKIGFFTFGVPNRIGLNQYGAKGRADAGQNYETILKAYYTYDEMKDIDVNTNIAVDGYGSYSIEDYVKRIYEMPGDWPSEALKAQAVAARSYAMAYTNNGQGSICATQNCQVFQPNPKGGAWEQAVNDTKGKVMQQGGAPIKAWFSSTHGGYVLSSGEIGWSATSWTKHATDANSGIGSLSDLQNNAYDKASPWFYCDWGSRSDYGGTAWLKTTEVADIANIIMLAKRDSSVGEHLYQADKPNPAGTDTWDASKVRSELQSRGGSPYSSVSDISVSIDYSGGRTTSVNISGDAGSNSFDAREFKDWFNLRAPVNIQIVGPLFNVERK
jgi:peptidoglycan hydrolase-like amidase